MANLTTSWQKYAEVSNTLTSNTTAWMGLYMKYARYTTYDRVYFEIRYWGTNPYGDYFAWSQEGTMNWSFTYQGQTKTGSFSSISITANQTPVAKASGYIDVYHTTAVSGSASITAVLYKANKSCSATVGLTTIASKSTVSVSSDPYLATDSQSGNAVTISCSNSMTSGITHTLKILNPNTSAAIETFTNVGTSQPWKPLLFNAGTDTPSIYTELITGESRTFTVECETFYNGTSLGKNTCTTTVHVPNQSNTKPTMQGGEFNITELNTAIPSAWRSAGVYIQSKSKLRFEIQAVTKVNSGMGAAAVNIDGTDYRATSSNGVDATVDMTKTIQTAGSLPIKVNVSDTRGFKWNDSTTSSDWTTLQTITATKYITPSFDGEPQISRVNSNGNPDDQGTYLAFSMKARISAITTGSTHRNTATFKIKWKQKSASTWNETTYTGTLDTTNDDWVVNISNQKLQQNGSDVTISASSAYDIRFELIDAFNNSSNPVYSTDDINVGGDLLNFNVNGHAMAIGQLSTAAQNEEKLEVAYPTSFKTMPMINGVSLLDFIYPIGAIYLSASSTNPGTIFGGTWEAWGTGRVPVGVDTSQTEFNSVEKTGGSKYLQEHGHNSINFVDGYTDGHSGQGTYKTLLAGPYAGSVVQAVRNAGTGNSGNLQPYITCYMWKRTA